MPGCDVDVGLIVIVLIVFSLLCSIRFFFLRRCVASLCLCFVGLDADSNVCL